jgi:predicted Zn finger-like uncharacterized protein
MMRLVCPNCEAKYEVPEDAIPETGRDVQCANCGHAWYQMRPRAAEAAATAVAPPAPAPAAAPEPVVEVAEVPAAPTEAPDPEPVAVVAEPTLEPEQESAPVLDAANDDVAEAPVEDEAIATADIVEEAVTDEPAAVAAVVAEEVPVAAAADDLATDAGETAETLADDVIGTQTADHEPSADAPVAEVIAAEAVVATGDATPEGDAPELDAAEADATEPAVSAAPAAAYAVDESVLAILREEAEREAQARRTEAAKPLETQTDLGIEAAIPAAKRSMEAIGHAAELDADDKGSNRRARLPDVEEINSTLRPSETAQDDGSTSDGVPEPVEGRSSFRSGFLLVLTVAILGAALYGSADAIAEAVPSLAGPLKAYVSFVDSLRLQLDGLMQSATVAINGDGA